MLDWLAGLFSKDIGIDLGTANTLVYVRSEGIIINEPSVVAVRKGTKEVLMDGNAVGFHAKRMLGREPETVQAVRPLRQGVIADFDLAESMISYFIRRVHNRSWGVKPRVVVAIPSGITEVEKRAVVSSAERAGVREVFLVVEPLAAAIGAGLPITDAVGSMIVDVGGGTSEVAVISLAGVVVAESLRVAGDAMDEAVRNHIREKHNLFVGQTTAERVKIEIGSAYPMNGDRATMMVRGRDTTTGLPREQEIGEKEIRDALEQPVGQIVRTIERALGKTRPELSADLIERGITLAGGGALLRGLDKVISEKVGLPVTATEDPLTVVAEGTGQIIEQLDELSDILESSRDFD